MEAALNHSFESIGTIGPSTITPDHVRGLSLTRVTKQYHTLGLYVRLQDTLASHGLDESPAVDTSVQLGMTLHANDLRTDGHYTDHLMRVTIRMIEAYGITDQSLIAAGPLHDSLEDHPRDLVFSLSGEVIKDRREATDRGQELIAEHIGEETAELVRLVTNPEVAEGQNKVESYIAHTNHVVRSSPKGRVLKLSDFIDNAVGNHHTHGRKRLDLDRKYLAAYRIHRMGLFLPDGLIMGQRRNDALAQLTRGHTRALARIKQAE